MSNRRKPAEGSEEHLWQSAERGNRGANLIIPLSKQGKELEASYSSPIADTGDIGMVAFLGHCGLCES
jgi:hypothetical protein